MTSLDKISTEKLQAFLPYCSIVIGRTSRDFMENEVNDFTQEWSIREEFPMLLFIKKAYELNSIGVSIGEE